METWSARAECEATGRDLRESPRGAHFGHTGRSVPAQGQGPRELNQKDKALRRFLDELLRRVGLTRGGRTLVECVNLLGGEVTTEGGAREWLRSEWTRMSRLTREIETLKRVRLGFSYRRDGERVRRDA